MAQAVLRVTGLPQAPLDAAARFTDEWLGRARAAAAQGDLALVFAPAGHEHTAWRLAMVQELAREAAPHRVNAVAGAEEAEIAETLAYLADAPGLTGQVVELAGNPGKMD